MIPKFRAWIIQEKKIVDVASIYFDHQQIGYYEKPALKVMLKFSEIELMMSTDGKHWYKCDDNLIINGNICEDTK